jgi:4'-phosphopantetheinyl transferase
MRAGSTLKLADNGVHVWTLRTSASDAVVAEFEGVLDARERVRATRFHLDRLRRSFIIIHGALRYLLAPYLGLDPASIRFAYSSKGKPSIAPASAIQFNLTHSGGQAAVALTADSPIGADMEQIRPLPEMQQIARRHFCTEEAAEILSLPPSERNPAFFRCWTRKEAYLKAIGDGLAAPLDGFRVSVRPTAPARVVHVNHDTSAAEAWTLQDLCLDSDYAAAIAYRHPPRTMSIFSVGDPAEFLEA